MHPQLPPVGSDIYRHASNVAMKLSLILTSLLLLQDIAGLVRAIYEVVGSSVEVPPSGSKTINVKLTVTPEKQRLIETRRQRDLSITIRGGDRRSKDDLDLRPEAPRPRFNSMRDAQPPAWRARSPGVDGSPALPRRQLPSDPVRHKHLVELLQTSMEKNNLTFNNLK